MLPPEVVESFCAAAAPNTAKDRRDDRIQNWGRSNLVSSHREELSMDHAQTRSTQAGLEFKS